MLNFIRRERIYILILFFILAVNAMHPGPSKKEALKEEKTLSGMTFEEIGVTEEKVRAFFESDRPSAKVFKYSISLGFFIFILSLALNILFIFDRRRQPGKVNFRGILPPVPWVASDIIRASIIIIFIGYIIAITEGYLLKIFKADMDMNFRMIANTFFIDLFAGIVVLYFAIVKHRGRLESLGLKFSSFSRNIVSGITAYIFIIPLLLAILFISVWLLNLLGYTPPPQPVLEAFMGEKRSGALMFLTIFVVVFGPIAEEIFFRGFMYSAVKKRLGILGAALLSASIFSLLHTNIIGFLPIMALGVLLAYLYETTGSLVAPIAVHVLHNSIIVAFVFFIKEVVS